MADENQGQDGKEYIQWKALPPGGPLNRWSHALTNDHDFPGAQVSEVPPSTKCETSGCTDTARPCSTARASRTRR